jgi:DNA-directed RNA polymerase subunit RPC12/RpoP
MQGPSSGKVDWLSAPAKDEGQAVYLCAGMPSPCTPPPQCAQSPPIHPLISIKSCYVECGAETKIKPRDRLKCESCHCNILYKKRTKRGIRQLWGLPVN